MSLSKRKAVIPIAHHLFVDARIETERLLLRPYQPDDAHDLFLAVSGQHFYDFIPGESTPTLKEVQGIIDWSISCCQRNTKEQIHKFNLGVICKETDRLIGYCGLGPYDLDPTKIEIYYGISERYTGRGFATEAAAAVLSYGLDVLELDEIITTVHPQNHASLRILQKIGMSYSHSLHNLPEDFSDFESYGYYSIKRDGHPKKLHISSETTQADKDYVRKKMYAFNAAHFPAELKGRYQEVNLFVKNAQGEVLGGLLGEICWNWLEVHYLYVSDELRQSGYGTKLMREAERIAREKQCDFIKLDTLSFQALDFYRKLGFEVYGQLPNAGGYTHYYLKRDL